MSTKYPGGFITKNYVAPTPSSASGIWTLDQQQQAQQAGIWPFGGPFNFIEDVFSTYLYTGNSSTQTITNGIDLAGEDGLVWLKFRSGTNTASHFLTTGAFKNVGNVSYPYGFLTTNNTNGIDNFAYQRITSFNSDGFTLGGNTETNYNGDKYVSWTFRKQPKFFDVVTWTGNGSDPRNISHNLGSVPGCIIIKCTSTGATDWFVYHRSLGNSKSLNLNQTGAAETGTAIWGTTTPTSTVFTVGNINSNTNGRTYVAYLFAHDAGGFGSTNTDNVISCGSFTNNGSGAASVTLGYEPQWVMIKNSQAAEGWLIADNMRGMPVGSADAYLQANSSAAEASYDYIDPTATGFNIKGLNSSQTYIYIAIRRGPMKVPTDGTSVFSPIAAVSGVQTTNFPVDMQILSLRDGASALLNHQVIDRLRGVSSTSTAQGNYLNTTSTAAESSANPFSSILMSNVGFQIGNNYAGGSGVFHSFQRAPSFFDEVCYTGNNVDNRTIPHNLTVAPELTIIKMRSGDTTRGWRTYTPNAAGSAKWGMLNLTNAFESAPYIPSVSSTTITLSSDAEVNRTACNYVAYLFATCPGVSKVGSYTGTGTTQTINCGFTAGSRFIMIKRTDSTGDWYVWDSARGIIAGNDPYVLMNTTAAEVTNTDYVDTAATGFEISSTAPAAINANGGTFIFLAIA